MIQMPAEHTYGDYFAPQPVSREYLRLQFSPNSLARQQRWRNYGLSADFLGDYFATFFPGDEIPDGKINRRDTVKASVSYIANELLENAIKHNHVSFPDPISIALHLKEHQLVFHVVNYATQEVAENYQTFIQTILDAKDLQLLYLEQLEKTAINSDESRMGLLTMMSDYEARFGWRFKGVSSEADIIQVDVMAFLDI
jgi:hypothetical protein